MSKSIAELKKELQESLKDLQGESLFKVIKGDKNTEYLDSEDFEFESHMRQGEIAAMISDDNFDRGYFRK